MFRKLLFKFIAIFLAGLIVGITVTHYVNQQQLITLNENYRELLLKYNYTENLYGKLEVLYNTLKTENDILKRQVSLLEEKISLLEEENSRLNSSLMKLDSIISEVKLRNKLSMSLFDLIVLMTLNPDNKEGIKRAVANVDTYVKQLDDKDVADLWEFAKREINNGKIDTAIEIVYKIIVLNLYRIDGLL